MNDLIALVVKNVGIDADKAKSAVETVLGFLKDKLPGPVAGQLDGLLGEGGTGDLAKKLGGLLGK